MDTYNKSDLLKKDIDYIKKEVNAISKSISAINNTLGSVRNDVNLANTRSTENRVTIRDLDKRVASLERINLEQETVRKTLVATARYLGLSNFAGFISFIGLIIYLVQEGSII